MKRSFFFGLVLGVSMLIVVGCAPGNKVSEQPESVKFGWIGPLSGDMANLGKDALMSAQIAIDEVNAAGGIDGRQIELIAEDGKCKPKEGAIAGSKLINIDDVDALFAVCSPEVVAVATTANQTRTPLLSSCASAPHITDAGDYIFRTYPSDAFQGVFAAKYAYEQLGARKVAVLAMQNDWGIGLQQVFKKQFEELGGTVALVEKADQDARDVRGQLTKIANAGVDLLYFPAFTELSIAGLRQAQDLGLVMPIFGGDAWSDPLLRESGYADGIFYTMPSESFQGEWREKMAAYGANTTICAPAAYDNVKILADIIARVGVGGQEIKDELYKVKEYPGVNGPISLDKNGDLEGASYDVYRVEERKEVLVTL